MIPVGECPGCLSSKTKRSLFSPDYVRLVNYSSDKAGIRFRNFTSRNNRSAISVDYIALISWLGPSAFIVLPICEADRMAASVQENPGPVCLN